MTMPPTASRNYATSIFDQRTQHSRAQASRTSGIEELAHALRARPEPVYAADDQIRIEDGTLRTITFRMYSALQMTWLYRLTTTQRNQYNGFISTANLTEEQVIKMDKSDALPEAANSQEKLDGWIVQFKSELHSLFLTWTNSDGGVAVFEKDIAIRFAQGMVMAYDSAKQWAFFRVRPYEGYEGEQWFFTLIQPDNKYTAAVSAFAEYHSHHMIGLAEFNDEGFPIQYTYNDEAFLFLRRAIDNWRVEYMKEGCTGYSNPNRPKFSNGDILKLPTGFMRPVQFITPCWIKAEQIGFRYWFYIQGKQLVDYAENELTPTDVEVITLESESIPKSRKVILEVADVPIVEPNVQCVLATMQAEIDSLKSQNKALENSLRISNKRLKFIQAKLATQHLLPELAKETSEI